MLEDIFGIIDGPISVETVSLHADLIVKQGRAIAKLHRNAVVKVPTIEEGLKAVKSLAAEGIRPNVTLCFSPLQAFLAAKAGATYISPFIHRKDLAGEEGMLLVRQIRQIFDRHRFQTKVLAASIRTSKEVLDCPLAGADVATMPFDILQPLHDRRWPENVSG